MKQGVHIIHDKNNDYKILSKPDEILSPGDVVTWEDNDWLIVRTFGDSQVQTKGIIVECNNVLNYYNQSNILYQIPCAIESSVQLYRMSVDTNSYFSELGDVIVVRVANNAITSNIDIDHIYKIGKWNYRVINLSDVIEPGIIVLKMEFSQQQQIIPSPLPSPAGYSLTGADEIKLGSTQTYIASKQADNNAVFTFSIIGDVPSSAYDFVIIDGKSCSIKCNGYTHYIQLVATDVSDISKSASISIRLRPNL